MVLNEFKSFGHFPHFSKPMNIQELELSFSLLIVNMRIFNGLDHELGAYKSVGNYIHILVFIESFSQITQNLLQFMMIRLKAIRLLVQ